MLSDKIIRFHIVNDYVDPVFCVLSFSCGYGATQIKEAKSGMAESQVNISQEKFKKIILLIPPLSEQKRIVAKVDQLMALCDKLLLAIAKQTFKENALIKAISARV
jgi:type I restriction enzyme, S subunit